MGEDLAHPKIFPMSSALDQKVCIFLQDSANLFNFVPKKLSEFCKNVGSENLLQMRVQLGILTTDA